MSADLTELSDVRLSEADVKIVLERAARIETRANSLSVAELSSVAREAGISEQAVVQAVLEMLEERRMVQRPAEPAREAQPNSPPAARPNRFRAWVTAAGCALAGVLAGGIAEAGDGPALYSVGLLLVALTFRAFHHRSEGSQRDLQLELVSAWAGFVAGFGMVDGGLDDDLVLVAGLFWLASVWVGGIIVATKRIKEWRLFSVFRPETPA